MSDTLALIVDDEPDLIQLVSIALSQMQIDSIGASSLKDARQKLASQPVNFCLTDMQLPDGEGLELVREMQRDQPHIPVAVITAHGNMDKAIESLKAGAFDYVAKPLDIDILRKMVRQASLLNSSMRQEPQTVSTTNPAGALLDRQLVGESSIIMNLKQQVLKVAKSQAPVFIRGESGTGKEVVARCIHELSPRKNGPFVAVNCGAIPQDLIESELFGHKRGSFSGAIADKTGLFEAAEGGTLFLDEVADIPIHMQVKLLRVIQEKKLRPVGETQERNIDCRLLSATHKNLEELIKDNLFRDDLYYRINVIALTIPALRERGEDVILIANHILQSYAKETDQLPLRLSTASEQLLRRHHFPGNIRELQNALQRAHALCDQETIEPEHLQLHKGVLQPGFLQNPTDKLTDALSTQPNLAPPVLAPNKHFDTEPDIIQPGEAYDPQKSGPLEEYLKTIEKNAIKDALEATHWNRTAAAKLLGMTFRSLRYRLKKLDLDD